MSQRGTTSTSLHFSQTHSTQINKEGFGPLRVISRSAVSLKIA
jgi:hypothetical protein